MNHLLTGLRRVGREVHAPGLQLLDSVTHAGADPPDGPVGILDDELDGCGVTRAQPQRRAELALGCADTACQYPGLILD